jgi:hypothetical protein
MAQATSAVSDASTMKEPNYLFGLVDEAARDSWIEESRKWREREESGIQSYPWERYEIPDTTVTFGSTPETTRRNGRASIGRSVGISRGIATFVTCGAFLTLPITPIW